MGRGQSSNESEGVSKSCLSRRAGSPFKNNKVDNSRAMGASELSESGRGQNGSSSFEEALSRVSRARHRVMHDCPEERLLL
jgi:hypothetical protein